MANISPKAKSSLEKIQSFAVMQDGDSWLDYIDDGALNLKEIAKICNISRSTLYDNAMVKNEIIRLATELLNRGVIQKLPYASSDSGLAKASKTAVSKFNKEIEVLRLENQSLKNRINELLVQIDAKNKELLKYNSIEKILGDTGRVPR
tara:strand:+ start:11713 stop:12159 length:447 start_codon:yes stop_codon:yes gene_type:complete